MTICHAADATSAASRSHARCPAPAAASTTAAGPASKRPTGNAADAPPEPQVPSATGSSTPRPQTASQSPGAKIHDHNGAKSLDDTHALFVWRSQRVGGDTKTPKSRRTLALARKCAEALHEQRTQQAVDRLAAGQLWQDHDLIFASTVGTPLDDHNIRRQFRKITAAAGLGSTWVPRELRHTFVSLLSAHGVPVEAIALLAGHNQTATTEMVYRHQIVPALTRGAEVMDQIFG